MISLKSYITEIYRKEQGEYSGGKSALAAMEIPDDLQKKPLPSHSGLTYAIDKYDSTVDLYIFNKEQCIAAASLENIKTEVPKEIKLPFQMNAITVDEDYRGKGIASALYDIVFTTLKGTLVSGDEQTPGGRKNWVNLMTQPGVEIKGVFSIKDSEIDSDNNIDEIMELGLQYFGKKGKDHFFAYDVSSGKTELDPFIKTKLNQLYSNTRINRKQFLIAQRQ